MENYEVFGKKVVKCHTVALKTHAWLFDKYNLPLSALALVKDDECECDVTEFTSVAKCHEEDMFDEHKGMRIASVKNQIKLHNKRMKDLQKVRTQLMNELEKVEELLSEETAKTAHQIVLLGEAEKY